MWTALLCLACLVVGVILGASCAYLHAARVMRDASEKLRGFRAELRGYQPAASPHGPLGPPPRSH